MSKDQKMDMIRTVEPSGLAKNVEKGAMGRI